MRVRKAGVRDYPEVFRINSELTRSPPSFLGYLRILLDPNIVVIVAEEDGKVVGKGNLVVHRALARGGARVGRVEEVVVKKEYRGRGIGTEIVRALLEEARRRRVYKVELACEEELEGFYGRLGFKRSGISMKLYCK